MVVLVACAGEVGWDADDVPDRARLVVGPDGGVLLELLLPLPHAARQTATPTSQIENTFTTPSIPTRTLSVWSLRGANASKPRPEMIRSRHSVRDFAESGGRLYWTRCVLRRDNPQRSVVTQLRSVIVGDKSPKNTQKAKKQKQQKATSKSAKK